MQEKSKKASSAFAAVTAVQFICVFTIIAGILITKFVFPAEYKRVCTFFRSSMCEETNAGELLSLFADEV